MLRVRGLPSFSTTRRVGRRVALVGAGPGIVLTAMQANFAEEPISPLPAGSSVVVVGAGVVGVSTAHALATEGYRVRVLEAGPEVCSPQSASWGNAGTVGQSTKTQPLSSADGLIRTIKGVLFRTGTDAPNRADGAGANPEFDRHRRNMTVMPSVAADPYFYLWGLTFLSAFAHSLVGSRATAALDQWWRRLNADAHDATFALARREGLVAAADLRSEGRLTVVMGPTQRQYLGIEAAEVEAALDREPALASQADRIRSATVTPVDSQGACAAFTRGLASACEKKHGVTFEVGTEVAAVVRRGGAARGVRTAAGEVIEADAVVLCTGACTAPLALSAGVYAPVQPLRGYSLTARVRRAESISRTEVAEEPIRHHVVVKPFQLYLTRLGDSLRFSCYGELAPVRGSGSGEATAALSRQLASLVEFVLPGVASMCEWTSAVGWVGARPLTPDCMPLVGPTRVRGLFLNAGHSFNGWREAAHSAELVAARVAGKRPHAGAGYLPCFSITRFQPFPNPPVHCLAPDSTPTVALRSG